MRINLKTVVQARDSSNIKRDLEGPIVIHARTLVQWRTRHAVDVGGKYTERPRCIVISAISILDIQHANVLIAARKISGKNDSATHRFASTLRRKINTDSYVRWVTARLRLRS